MNGFERLTDERLDAVFTRRARQGDVGDVDRRIRSAVATTQQVRRPWAPPLRDTLHGPWRRALVAAVVTIVALLALLLASTIAGQRDSDRLGRERLSFIRDGDVYVARGDGTEPVRVLHEDGITFSDPAWSPDGSRLALDSSGGAIVLDVASGAIERIGGNAPAWSPDGRELAVVDVGYGGATDIRIVDAPSAATVHTYTLDASGPLAWSPDGRWIAASGQRLDVANGTTVQIDAGSPGFGGVSGPETWSPDSTRIAFVQVRGCGEVPPGVPGCGDVYGRPNAGPAIGVANADGSQASLIMTSVAAGDEPRWSPDGQWIAYRQVEYDAAASTLSPVHTVTGIGIMRPDGSGARTVATAKVDSYAWSADSGFLLFSAPSSAGASATLWQVSVSGDLRTLPVAVDASVGSDPSTAFALAAAPRTLGGFPPVTGPDAATAVPRIDIVTPPTSAAVDPSAGYTTMAWPGGFGNTDGCAPSRMSTRTNAVTQVAMICADQDSVSSVAWSPDGTTYAAVVQHGNEVSLTLVRSNGQVKTRVDDLVGDPSCCLGWSPDGRWLTVGLGTQNYVLRSDGSSLKNIPGSASWSPDSRRLAVQATDGTLLIGGPNGADLRSIGSFPNLVGWSPDASRFMFIRDGDVWTAAVDGTDVRNLTQFKLGGATEAAWSPDGGWIAVAPGRGLWLIQPDGRDRRFLDLGAPVVGIAWSPDGRRLAVETGTGDLASSNVEVLQVDGSTAAFIASAAAPAWSPDGRYLVVATSGGAPDVMNADGSGRRSYGPIRYDYGMGQPPVWIR